MLTSLSASSLFSEYSHDESMTYLRQANGIFIPTEAVVHRDNEYDSRSFSLIRDIQLRHF
jgi:hypothetical protein